MTVEGIKKRLALFNQYDQAMGKFVEELQSFKTNITTLFNQKPDSIKLYGHAFNLAWTLRNDIELCQQYDEEIRNSLLRDRFEQNKQMSDKVEHLVNDIVPHMEKLIDTWSFNIEDNREEIITEEAGEERAKLLSDNEYLLELSKDLAKNGNKILSIVCFYLRHISGQLISIKTARANMSDNDYRFLFEREFRDYLSTDEWSDLKYSFIERTIRNKYHGSEPTKEQLYVLLSEEIEKIVDMSDQLGTIEPYLDDYPKLARIIVNKELRNEISTPLLDLMRHLGRKGLIEEWQEQLEEEEQCYVLEDDEEEEVTYSERFSEAICRQTMPEILALYEKRDATDWVCFFHVLVFYSYLACDDFNVFNRWLTQITGREIISPGNARKIKMSYWAKDAKKKWSVEKALEETNTAQQETKFRNYTSLCDDIREIINKAKGVAS